ncbi:hypothetical protein IGI04_035688 [Brassica rapa subsp. trilocularis]|uniref:Uncharacterized protein n=1 Tax=Brassica rapa subsp. trilocularis TaxID=1813537 RepID=A0ABQ7LCH0_BRACM|nr:hypothetical protein IGI04_035688 [Brassica rapa subsp. trilocularis]
MENWCTQGNAQGSTLTLCDVPRHFKSGLAPKTAAVRLSLFRADLFVGKKLQLTQRGTVQMLTLSKDTALEVESLVQVLDSYGGSLRCHSMIVFQHFLVSTTLSRDDTV